MLLALPLPLPAQAGAPIRIDGSSTVYPVTEAVAEEFQIARKGAVRVTVGISGTGGGFKKFCRGEIDIANASRPIKRIEMNACAQSNVRFIEIPIAFDALTVVVHPSNNWVDKLTVAQLRRIWQPSAQGRVVTWDQVDSGFPKEPLRLFGPGADSGTFEYFTEAVMRKSRASRGDYTASEDDNVLVQGVARQKGALGYFGFAYYVENKDKLKAVPIDNGNGPVYPSDQAVEDGSYQPLARPVFIYVKEESLGRPEVREFVEYYLANAAKYSREVKYVPLPPKVYEAAMKSVRERRVGTVFGSREAVGVTMEQLATLEPSL
jgi:phosphate transport system substrate-binding protein